MFQVIVGESETHTPACVLGTRPICLCFLDSGFSPTVWWITRTWKNM